MEGAFVAKVISVFKCILKNHGTFTCLCGYYNQHCLLRNSVLGQCPGLQAFLTEQTTGLKFRRTLQYCCMEKMQPIDLCLNYYSIQIRPSPSKMFGIRIHTFKWF